MTVLANEGRWDACSAIFQDGRIKHYEKDRTDAAEMGMRHIDCGLSVLTAKVVRDGIKPAVSVDLGDLYTSLSRAGNLKEFEVLEGFYEVGSP